MLPCAVCVLLINVGREIRTGGVGRAVVQQQQQWRVCVQEGWTPPSLHRPSAADAADYSACLRCAFLVHIHIILLYTCVIVVVVLRNRRHRGMCPRPSSLPSPPSLSKHHGQVSRRRRIVLPSAAPQTSSAAATVYFWLRPISCCGPAEKASETMGKKKILT